MKFNVPKIIWVSCLFLELIVILIMVMDYKINYQYSNDKETKLYFYDCSGELCTSEVKNNSKKLYSVFDCWYTICPVYKKIINEDYALLEEAESLILYNYKNGNTITSNYDNYTFINNDYIIVTKDKRDGIIDLSDNLIVDVIYDKIGYFNNEYLTGYNTSNIIAKKDDKYGIISFKDGKVVEEFKYTEEEVQKLLNIINNE